MEELKNILVNSLFILTVVYNISHFSNFSDCMDFYASFNTQRELPFVYILCTRIVPLCAY
jgi:hypothetical protein